MLERHPEWLGVARFVAHLVPSRTSIKEYATYTERTLRTVERINGRFGSASWQPIEAFHRKGRLEALAAMRSYDVLLVNSIADGMNLVSKEGPLLNERAGVLVLSRQAGSFADLGEAAIGIDPRDVSGTAEALHQALSMAAPDRQQRAERLRSAVLAHQLRDWLRIQLEDLGVGLAPARRTLPGVGACAPRNPGVPSLAV
jgi:trehalose 6-phosphate synthase